jgi:hypothetical protein
VRVVLAQLGHEAFGSMAFAIVFLRAIVFHTGVIAPFPRPTLPEAEAARLWPYPLG